MNIFAPFTERQNNYLSAVNHSWFNVSEGGKRGGKNVLQTFAFCLRLETHPNRIHLIAGFSVATARLNIMDCDGYGLLNYFEGRCRTGTYQKRDCLYVKTLTGDKIILISGGGKNGDEKLIKGNSYGMAYVTEANECSLKFLNEVFDRTIASKDRMIFHDLNPKAEGHWYYRDIINFHEKKQASDTAYGYNYGHFTLTDNMSLSDAHIKKIISTYDRNSVWFQRDILGKRRQAEGLIYDVFDIKLHTYNDSKILPRKGSRYITVDYGTVNPMVYLEVYDTGNEIYIRKEYYYDSQSGEADSKGRSQKSDREYGDEMDKFVGGDMPVNVIIDPSASSFEVELSNRGYRVQDADNAVADGIRMVYSMFFMQKIFIHESCVNTISELQSYPWDEKALSRGEEIPLEKFDHTCDALRYFVKTVIDPWRFAK